ncbi:sugar transferase [Shewanella khirikhana]|uniref:UDP-N-acetylgalactosamine-undecaprenyl-phosphate N-acetylgalactosaminephosphotransferase n=1 Tax=Shewanella khirikhana TaxID=1965282 RepID=A0ABN5TV94_9GAMM|nr:sugar transferase [Shewanella khirikhana]AZQ11101.1 UDP-N-acetylgalactosamine-undecaprenyl-phosphate N-acetylgalactosaminephosphotransferase [Shewanella khirikhana]
MKRIFDFFCALLAIIILFPLLIFVSVFIKLGDRGPVIFRQNRVGKAGKVFQIYKFRTMVTNAESIGSYSTSNHDPRITKVGRFLRKSSIDELPQLFNVLVGDMSIVGPRPNVEAQIELYRKVDWDKRNSVIPGITGLSQCTIRSSGTERQRLKYDLFYVENQSFYFDLIIIAKTVKQVIFKGGN